MKGKNAAIVAGLAIVVLVAGFWFVALSPQRGEAAELGERIEQLQVSVSEHEQRALAAEEARERFDRNYQRLVVLGKAVPDDEDTASLFVQLDEIASKSKLDLQAINLQSTGPADASAPPPAPPAQSTEEGPPEDGDAAEAPAEPVVPTEATVASMPLGATVGPAGLPVMPYRVDLKGSFFEIADFLKGVDALVRPRGGSPRVRGRLLTVNGFSLTPDKDKGLPHLNASLSVASFVTPADQGLLAGASPAGPPPAPAAPASASTP